VNCKTLRLNGNVTEGYWSEWRLAEREVPPGERSKNRGTLERWRLTVVIKPPGGGDNGYAF